jgi:hypothetical protein
VWKSPCQRDATKQKSRYSAMTLFRKQYQTLHASLRPSRAGGSDGQQTESSYMLDANVVF